MMLKESKIMAKYFPGNVYTLGEPISPLSSAGKGDSRPRSIFG
jgi:hypothetical protein